MRVGIAKENRPQEKRVIMQPPEIKRIAKRHEVVVEKGAGLSIDIPDENYIKVGCKIGSREEVYNSDLVVRIKEPNFEEIKMMRPGAIIMSMMHIRCQPELDEALHKQKLIVIPLENLKDPVGRRKVDAVEDAGRIGLEYGFKLWGKDPATATVKIMGYGNIAMGAIRSAARKFAKVEILNKKNFLEMEKHIPGTDILVDAINRPYRREVDQEPYFVTRQMLKLFKQGSVIVDLVSNPEKHAPAETMHPTYLDNLHYVVDGIYHTSCWGWPGLEPKKIAKRYSLQIAPILRDIANKGLDKCSPQTRIAVLYPENKWV
jgi:alanine dehydrogenase